jgi:hypothetical protein
MLRKIKILFALLLVTPVVALADLTGTWNSDDGGTYYLRQLGTVVHWYGERSANNPNWSNVFNGRIQGGVIRGAWTDVPKGQTMNNGQLRLRIKNGGNVLEAEHKTGGFGGSRWTRAGYVAPAPSGTLTPMPLPPGTLVPVQPLNEDCVSFNPNTTQVQHVNGRWKIVDGSHWMFDFGNKEGEALKALRAIKRYNANKSCFVGRPHASFTYLKRGNNAPVGHMPGEDCIGFNTANAKVQHINGRWKIVDGSHWMFDFGNKEAEARTSLQVIKKYGFNKSCFVGRPDPSFTYLRR